MTGFETAGKLDVTGDLDRFEPFEILRIHPGDKVADDLLIHAGTSGVDPAEPRFNTAHHRREYNGIPLIPYIPVAGSL
jgi:hypothetical protein